MGELLGREFVKEYFSPQAKKRYEDMVEAVKSSFADHIRNLEWMSPETKVKALTKLQTMNKKWAILISGKTLAVWRLQKFIL